MKPIQVIEFLFIVLIFSIGIPYLMPKEYPCINGSVYAKPQNTFYKLVDKDNLHLKCGEIK